MQISILICYPLNPFPIYEYPCVKFHRGILFAIIYNNTFAQFGSVLIVDFFFCYHRIRDKLITVKVFFSHIDSGDAVIIVSCVIINAFIRITARGIDSNLVLSVFYLTAASLLVNRAEYMEKLAYAFGFAFFGNGVSLYKKATRTNLDCDDKSPEVR